MDENSFASLEWLQGKSAVTDIENRRNEIARYNDWDAGGWYEDESLLKQFYNGIADDSSLIAQLDEDGLSEDKADETPLDPSKLAEWLGEATDAMFDVATFDTNYEMWYRLNNITSLYWWFYNPEAPGPDAEPPLPSESVWMSQEEADQLMRDWAAQAPGEAVASAAAAAATWDENWNMFYRINAAGTYEYAFSTTGNESGEPKSTWYSYEEVPNADPELQAPDTAVAPTLSQEEARVVAAPALQQLADYIGGVDSGLASRVAATPNPGQLLQEVLVDVLQEKAA